MGILSLLGIAVGLSADAFAASVCKGLRMRKFHRGQALQIGLLFGGFQALMPWIGWAIGSSFEQYIVSFDHWIAFALLAFIGAKMLWDAIRSSRSCPQEPKEAASEAASFSWKELLLLAIATSIDALAVGVTFALTEVWINIGLSVLVIGVTTCILSFLGTYIGNRFGARFQNAAEILGGSILVLIGCKILCEHLGFFG